MKEIKLNNLDLELFTETLDNGLEIYIIPKKTNNNIFVTYSTKYGSIQNEFIPIGEKKMKKVPGGIAHFLEHKMFEQESGVDPFAYFSERGADANANTNYYKTTYLFSGTNFFKENLTFLLDYVEHPYFTEENVEKEKGIIEQEIAMYQDDAYSRLFEEIMYNAFVNHPIRYPVIGTKESVRSITKDDLYTCYNTFYHPSNMFVVVTGNVEPLAVVNIIKEQEETRKVKPLEKIKVAPIHEPDTVFRETEELTMNITIPKVCIGYKINMKQFKNINPKKVLKYLLALLDIKLGPISDFLEKLKKEQIVTSDLGLDYIDAGDHILLLITADTKYPEELIKEVETELSSLEISEKDLNRQKKAILSAYIFMSDNIYSMNYKVMNDIIRYKEVICNDCDIIKSLNSKEYEQVKKNIKLNNKTTFIIKPKK